jgi:hypothetical protein
MKIRAAVLAAVLFAAGCGSAPPKYVTFKWVPCKKSTSNCASWSPEDYVLSISQKGAKTSVYVCVTEGTWSKYRAGDEFDPGDARSCKVV